MIQNMATSVAGGETVEPTQPELNGAESDESDPSLTTRVFDQMQSFQRLVVGGVTLAVGVLVYNEVIGALPSSGNSAISQTPITSTVESAFTLAPVALIVIIAAVILAQVGGFMGGR